MEDCTQTRPARAEGGLLHVLCRCAAGDNTALDFDPIRLNRIKV